MRFFYPIIWAIPALSRVTLRFSKGTSSGRAIRCNLFCTTICQSKVREVQAKKDFHYYPYCSFARKKTSTKFKHFNYPNIVIP